MTSLPPLNAPDSVPAAIASLSFIPDSNEALSDELTRLAGHINAAQYRFLKLLAALIERNAWGGDSGMKTPAHWLNYNCGIDLGAARQKVKVAKALAHLPQIDAAFASGAISYSKVRAMTRTATPETEATLLNIAKHGTAQHVESVVRQHRRVKRLDRNAQTDEASGDDTATGAAQQRARELSWFFAEDGMMVMNARFPPEEGAVLVKALEAALDVIGREQAQECAADDVSGEDRPCEQGQAEDVSAETSEQPDSEMTFQQKRGDQPEARDTQEADPDVSAETPEQEEARTTFPQKRADALARLAEHFLASSQQDSLHSQYSGRTLANGDKYQVLVHFDARATSELQQMGMPTHLDDGPPLPDSTFKRLACDAALIPVLRDDTGNVLNIGRKSRAVPPSIRRALTIRDGGCRHPGCCQTKYVDAHHIQHWCDGGETSLENLVLLCRYHHRALHEGVFSIEKDCTGGSMLRFMDRNGREIKPAPYPQFNAPRFGDRGETEVELDNEQRGLEIDARTAVTRWQGERLDYGMALDALMRGS